MTKKMNKRAKPGSGVKHDKHAPCSKEDIAAAEETAADTKSLDNKDNNENSDNTNED